MKNVTKTIAIASVVVATSATASARTLKPSHLNYLLNFSSSLYSAVLVRDFCLNAVVFNEYYPDFS